MSEVYVESVHVHANSAQHVVLLRERDRDRYLPIWVGPWEASAIATRLQGMVPERPLTHDLYLQTLLELEVHVKRVVVTDLADDTYRACIVVAVGEDDREVDARPSDAIAIAMRAGAPIFVADAILDRVGVLPGGEQEARLSMFREFVNSLEMDLGGGSDRDTRAPG